MPTTQKHEWNIIGHEDVLCFLDSAIRYDRVHHAYIIDGPESIGKSTLARQFCARLLDTKEDVLDTHMDVVVLEREMNAKTKKLRERISVEQVQSARARFSMSTMGDGYKVMIVKDAHLLSDSASNALLKTLEEPRGKACIILTTTDASLLMRTIRSRSQTISLHPVANEVIEKALVDRGVDKYVAAEVVPLSQGRPLYALQLAESDEKFERLKEDLVRAHDLLSTTPPKRILAARNTLPEYDEDHVKTRTELFRRLRLVEMVARDDLLRNIGCDELVSEVDVEAELSRGQSYRALVQLGTLYKDLSHHLNPKMALINFAIQIGNK